MSLARRVVCAAAAGCLGLAVTPVVPATARPTLGQCEVHDAMDQGVATSTQAIAAQIRLHWQDVWQTTRGEGITVAVIDSGFTAGGKLSRIRVVPGVNVTDAGFDEPSTYTVDCGGSAKAESGKDQPTTKDLDHGTFVTSIIAAPPDSDLGGSAQTGFYGVAPDATILPIKADPNGPKQLSSESIARGIRVAVDRGARVINVSAASGENNDIRSAVQYAAQKNVVIVAAAGNIAEGANTTPTPRYPAAYAGGRGSCSNVISVGAVGNNDALLDTSNPTSHVTVVAPGEGVTVLGRNGHVYHDSGTSFATPFVTGTVALMLAAHKDWTPTQVCQQLAATAQRVSVAPNDPTYAGYGWGILDPVAAVTSPLSAPQSAAAQPAQTVPRVVVPRAADHSLRDRAALVAFGLLGLAAVASVAGLVWRRTRRTPGTAMARRT